MYLFCMTFHKEYLCKYHPGSICKININVEKDQFIQTLQIFVKILSYKTFSNRINVAKYKKYLLKMT